MENESQQPMPPIPVSPPQLPGNHEKTERAWVLWTHLSTLSAYIGLPLGNIIAPLVIWSIKKGDYPRLEEQGKDILKHSDPTEKQN